jgi:holo-[acyl-carrier protein] synthase
MASPSCASKSRASRATRLVRGSLAALIPLQMPTPRPWGSGSRMLRPGRCEDHISPTLGVDLVPISQVRRVFEGKGPLLAEVFTEKELRYCTGQRRPFQHLAARYAAKEAVFKGLGTGMTGRMHWRDVETFHGAWGDPHLTLRGEVARLARAKGLRRCALSLTHAGDYAMAAVLFAP